MSASGPTSYVAGEIVLQGRRHRRPRGRRDHDRRNRWNQSPWRKTPRASARPAHSAIPMDATHPGTIHPRFAPTTGPRGSPARGPAIARAKPTAAASAWLVTCSVATCRAQFASCGFAGSCAATMGGHEQARGRQPEHEQDTERKGHQTLERNETAEDRRHRRMISALHRGADPGQGPHRLQRLQLPAMREPTQTGR